MKDSVFRRFIPIGTKEEMDRLQVLMEEKSLSREDLMLILRTIKLRSDISQRVFPEGFSAHSSR